MTALACRACRTVLSADRGCGICDPFRKNIVVIGDRPEDRVDLGDLTTEALAAARDRLKVIRGMKPDDKRYSPGELQGLVKTIAVMADAARKVRKDGVAAVKSMSFQERAELFLDWYDNLPTAHRSYLDNRLTASREALQ